MSVKLLVRSGASLTPQVVVPHWFSEAREEHMQFFDESPRPVIEVRVCFGGVAHQLRGAVTRTAFMPTKHFVFLVRVGLGRLFFRCRLLQKTICL